MASAFSPTWSHGKRTGSTFMFPLIHRISSPPASPIYGWPPAVVRSYFPYHGHPPPRPAFSRGVTIYDVEVLSTQNNHMARHASRAFSNNAPTAPITTDRGGPPEGQIVSFDIPRTSRIRFLTGKARWPSLARGVLWLVNWHFYRGGRTKAGLGPMTQPGAPPTRELSRVVGAQPVGLASGRPPVEARPVRKRPVPSPGMQHPSCWEAERDGGRLGSMVPAMTSC
jgi:hypothetical protein